MKPTQNEKLTIRVTKAQKLRIAEAARISEMSVSRFALKVTLHQAEMVIRRAPGGADPAWTPEEKAARKKRVKKAKVAPDVTESE